MASLCRDCRTLTRVATSAGSASAATPADLCTSFSTTELKIASALGKRQALRTNVQYACKCARVNFFGASTNEQGRIAWALTARVHPRAGRQPRPFALRT